MRKKSMAVILSMWLTVIGLSISTCLLAQQQQGAGENALVPTFGIKGGLNLTNMYVHDVKDEHVKAGLNLGVFAKLPVTTGFSIQPELLYSMKGAKENYDNPIVGSGEYRFNLNYVELPVLAVFNVTKNFNLHAGAYAAYLVGANVKDVRSDGTIKGATDLNTDNFNRFDVGLAGGLGVDVQKCTFGIRYNYGLREVGKTDLAQALTRNSKNSALSLYVGLGF